MKDEADENGVFPLGWEPAGRTRTATATPNTKLIVCGDVRNEYVDEILRRLNNTTRFIVDSEIGRSKITPMSRWTRFRLIVHYPSPRSDVNDIRETLDAIASHCPGTRFVLEVVA